MSEAVAAILNRYENSARFEAVPYANHWVVVDTLTGVTRHSYMHWDAESKAHDYAARLNGLVGV